MSTLSAQTILTTITSNSNHQIVPSDDMYLKEIDITTNVNTNPLIEQNVSKLLDNNQQIYSITPSNGYDGISNIDIQLQQNYNIKVFSIFCNNNTITKNNYTDFIGNISHYDTGYFLKIEFNIQSNLFQIVDIDLIQGSNNDPNCLYLPASQYNNFINIHGPNFDMSIRADSTECHFDLSNPYTPWLLIDYI